MNGSTRALHTDDVRLVEREGRSPLLLQPSFPSRCPDSLQPPPPLRGSDLQRRKCRAIRRHHQLLARLPAFEAHGLNAWVATIVTALGVLPINDVHNRDASHCSPVPLVAWNFKSTCMSSGFQVLTSVT